MWLCTFPSKSCTEAIMFVLLIVTYVVVDKAMEHKEEQR